MVKPQGCLILKWLSSVRYSFFVHSVFPLWAYSPISHFTVNLSSCWGFNEDSLGVSDENFNHTTADTCCILLHWSILFFFREKSLKKLLNAFYSPSVLFYFLLFFCHPEGLNTSLTELHVSVRSCFRSQRFSYLIGLIYLIGFVVL